MPSRSILAILCVFLCLAAPARAEEERHFNLRFQALDQSYRFDCGGQVSYLGLDELLLNRKAVRTGPPPATLFDAQGHLHYRVAGDRALGPLRLSLPLGARGSRARMDESLTRFEVHVPHAALPQGWPHGEDLLISGSRAAAHLPWSLSVSAGACPGSQVQRESGDDWSLVSADVAESSVFPRSSQWYLQLNEAFQSRRFSGRRPSYFGVARDGRHGQWPLQFHLSLAYPLFVGDEGHDRVYFAYDGAYDFYFGSRPSAPVISRAQNPGFEYESSLGGALSDRRMKKWYLGYFHESNGQSIDSRAAYESTPYAQDHVSRGWDYVQLGVKYEFRTGGGMLLSFYPTYRLFTGYQGFIGETEEGDVIASPATQPRIADFDGFRPVLRLDYKRGSYRESWALEPRVGLRLVEKGAVLPSSWLAGYSGPDYALTALDQLRLRLSLRLSWTGILNNNLPLHAFVHYGYGAFPADYHLPALQFGAGFRFW